MKLGATAFLYSMWPIWLDFFPGALSLSSDLCFLISLWKGFMFFPVWVLGPYVNYGMFLSMLWDNYEVILSYFWGEWEEYSLILNSNNFRCSNHFKYFNTNIKSFYAFMLSTNYKMSTSLQISLRGLSIPRTHLMVWNPTQPREPHRLMNF